MGRRRRFTRHAPKARPQGRLSMTNAGYGFVETAEGEFFIPRSGVGEAFDGDLVEVRPTGRRGSGKMGNASSGASRTKTAARVVSVIERATEEVVGRLEVAEPFGVVVPLDPRLRHDIFTRRSDAPDVPDGSIVRVRITAYPTRSSAACGVIEEVLDGIGDIDAEIVYERYGLPRAFSAEAIAEAEGASIDVARALAAGYRDERGRDFVTIDPPDARDFDDAICVERKGDGDRDERWRLNVAIADVSGYVSEGGALDQEARARGCSVYLADRVNAMLPERLSCDLCSLRPEEDRLVVIVSIAYDGRFERIDEAFYPAVIRSRAALAYDRVLELLEGARPDEEERRHLAMLQNAAALSDALEAQRLDRGGLDFQTVEPKAVLDDEGKTLAIEVREKNAATALVESAMIEANEAVARWMAARSSPMIYRVHERPDADALAGLESFFARFEWFDAQTSSGLALGEPKAIQRIIEAVKGAPEELLVNTLLLRAQQRARYSPENLGHYGLGAPVYTHFTSPIRRYPDLVVHRFLKAQLGYGERSESRAASLATIADHSSHTERNAEEAARTSQEQKMTRYMADRIGERFKGVISGVASYGFYVRLDIGPEGLVRARSFPDGPYTFQPSEHRLVGFKERRSFQLGQRVTVTLVEADLVGYRLQFSLA